MTQKLISADHGLAGHVEGHTRSDGEDVSDDWTAVGEEDCEESGSALLTRHRSERR